MYDRVLIPTDGSSTAMRGAEYGVRLAAAADATIHAVAVAEPGGFQPLDALFNPSEGSAVRGESDEEEYVRAVAGLADDHGVDVEATVRHGSPAEEIVSRVETTEPDLVAMGTRGRSGIGRKLLGSVAEEVVHAAPTPVLTTGGEDQRALAGESIDDILLPTRGGEEAGPAIDHAIDLATIHDATVHLLYVVDPDTAGVDPNEVTEAEDDLIDEVMGDARERSREAGLDVETTIRYGTPHEEIDAAAATLDVDLVTIGTATDRRFSLGGVTERTIRTADHPVLTVQTE
ncbi:hypothetical protein BRD17_00665 [Halobacteriales archaeon SW_7_68_16]|nr:MAG: hypothetical protein BRD17_00665 [Halobacteriales archaeon SW_7_68_16]